MRKIWMVLGLLAACNGRTVEYGGQMAAEDTAVVADTGAPDAGGGETGGDTGTDTETGGDTGVVDTGSPETGAGGDTEIGTDSDTDSGAGDTATETADTAETAETGNSAIDSGLGADTSADTAAVDCAGYTPSCDGTVVWYCTAAEVQSYDCADAGETCGSVDGVAQCVAVTTVDTAVEADDTATPCAESTWYRDADTDGYGAAGSCKSACEKPSGYVANNTDCDDATSAVYPGASETCDEQDNDCDGTVDEGVTTRVYRDRDGDGYGDELSGTDTCGVPSGYATTVYDCDDGDATIYTGATEIADDGVDQDCDGEDEETPESVICDGGDACLADTDEDGDNESLCLAADRFVGGEEYEEAPAYVVGDGFFDYDLETSDLVYPADGYFCLNFDELVSRTGSTDVTLVSSLDEDGESVDSDDMGTWVWWQNYAPCAGAEEGSEMADLCELQGDGWDYLLSVKWTTSGLVATGDGTR